MRDVLSGGLVAAALGAAMAVAGAFPASAQVARPHSALAAGGDSSDGLLTLVQDRNRGGGGGGGAMRGGGGGGRGDGGGAMRGGGRGDGGGFGRGASRGQDFGMRARGGNDYRVSRADRSEGRRWNRDYPRRWSNNNGRYRYGYRYGYPRYGYGYGYGSGLGVGLALSAPYYATTPYYGYDRGYYAGGDDDVAYCINRFQSYDPASRTYLGYDGFRHTCP